MSNYASTLNQLVDELISDGINGQMYDLENIMNNPKNAVALVELAKAIDKQYGLVQEAQQELGDRVIVQLGNGSDTNGATLAKGVIIKITLGMLNRPLYYIATPKGIAVGEKRGRKNNIFYSTHCMPLSYAVWISNNWGIQVEEHADAVTNSEVLKDNVKSSDVILEVIKEVISLQN